MSQINPIIRQISVHTQTNLNDMSKPKNKTQHLSFNKNMNRFLMCDICVITITILWQCTEISPKTEIKHTLHAAHLHECIYNSTNKNAVFNESKQSHF